ncbi:MAG: tRNA pseudouridine(38-40) synthase TruA [Kiritimatiellaceae bacterium]|nr:tRNA pseudouridine(38-40) synthase TruA [Kiritimatiellaceae bacterium]
MKTRYKLTISYDGTLFFGWQLQPGKRTVQGEVELAIKKISGQSVRIYHSGRTDAGVHAKGQVAHFDLDEPVDTWRFMNGLNAQLESDVRVMKMQKVRPDFNARYDAVSKEYRYFIWNGQSVPPELRLYRLHERRDLDLHAMQRAADRLVGTHDFAAFTSNPRREIEGTVKTVTKIVVRRSREGEITLRVVGEGFLYKMVRTLTGFLLRVGLGELQPEDADRLLKKGARTNEITTVRPQGLFLWRVDY